VQCFQAQDGLAEVLGGEGKREDLVWLDGLQVHEVATIAVLEHHVVVVLVLQKLLEFDDVFVVHFLHAGDFSLQVVGQVLVISGHLLLVDHFQRPLRTAFPLLHQEDVSEGALPQLPLADVPSQEDAGRSQSLCTH
jgi:hypothetical protein